MNPLGRCLPLETGSRKHDPGWSQKWRWVGGRSMPRGKWERRVCWKRAASRWPSKELSQLLRSQKQQPSHRTIPQAGHQKPKLSTGTYYLLLKLKHGSNRVCKPVISSLGRLSKGSINLRPGWATQLQSVSKSSSDDSCAGLASGTEKDANGQETQAPGISLRYIVLSCFPAWNC